MIEGGLASLLTLALGLGLIGFVEPCSIGASLVFIKTIEGKSAAVKVGQAILFALTRGVVIGGLGAAAALIGSAFGDLQRAGWAVLGCLYVGLGLMLATGRGRPLMVAVGPGLARLSGRGGAAGLGLLFGLNIPACAAPLLAALLTGAAARQLSPTEGFWVLGMFGLALSLPLVALVLVPAAQRVLDRFAGLSRRFPQLAGGVLLVLGLWSIAFAAFVDGT